MPKLVRITDRNYEEHLPSHNEYSTGLVPRDYGANPYGSLKAVKPFDIPLIKRSEMADRLAMQLKNSSQLTDIRDKGMAGNPIPSRDQDGYGYCWGHSTISAMLLARAVNNQPYADLSAFMVCCIVKDYKNKGGWGGESLEFVAANGVPTSTFWPQQAVDRKLDTPAMRENAALHKATEWMELDVSSPQYLDQYLTCMLLNFPIIGDHNWWQHSVCHARVKSFDFKSFAISSLVSTIWNSWSNDWSDNGMGDLVGRKALPDGAIALRVASSSAI